MKLLLLHGWGFDASLWDRLRRLFAPADTITWDRGYFGEARNEPIDGPFVAVGHSLGSMILTADPPLNCIGLIAINGFDRFAGEGAVPRRTIDRMRRRFAEAPAEVLDSFRSACGVSAAEKAFHQEVLAQDLEWLATIDVRDTVRPLLVLHGDADPILPPEMRATVFAGAPRRTLDGAGHLLPFTDPEWCAERIRGVLP